MSSHWGNNISFTIFGESHGVGIGAVLEGIPPGIEISLAPLQQFMQRRAPGRSKYATPRKETDTLEILSGIYHNKTTGTPISAIILNENTRSQDYESLPLRPSHADYTGEVRYDGFQDPRGGGHFSGRLTAPLVFAGGIAKQFLENFGIFIGAHIASIGAIDDLQLSYTSPDQQLLQAVSKKAFPALLEKAANQMMDLIDEKRMLKDSIGGTITCFATGVPAGLGSPMFYGLENVISSLVYAIPGVRSVSFGTGEKAGLLSGSEHNDTYVWEKGLLKTTTNHHGGILGGISSGMPIVMHTTIKPTPSIAQKQQSIYWNTKEETTLEIQGRHDPCIVPRAVPVVEAAVALALADALLEGGNPVAIELLSKRDKCHR